MLENYDNYDDLIVLVDSGLVASGLATRQRAATADGTLTGSTRWELHDRAKIRELAGQAVDKTDGVEERVRIAAIAAASPNPFLAFRQYMSPAALEQFALSLALNRIAP